MKAEDFIFKRYQPKKKLVLINEMTTADLLSISPSTIIRIIKETGTFFYQSKRNKKLYISNKAGNAWNSTMDWIEYYHGKLLVLFYVQYENTDTTTLESWETFLQSGTYEGKIEGLDYKGNSRKYYFNYDEDDKAGCVKAILLEYLNHKIKKENQA